MKRARTGTVTKVTRPASSTAYKSPYKLPPKTRLSATERKEVKALINNAAPKSVVHNGASSPAPPAGVLASAITSILTFGAIAKGTDENQRRGDQIWIHKIKFRANLISTSIEDVVRIMVARAPNVSGTPLPIDWTNVLQNAGAAIPGTISMIQDDNPYTILYDKTFTCGNKSANWGTRIVEFELDFSKRPLKMIFLDGSGTGSVSNIVMGNIELAACTQSAATTTMTYVYDVVFSEK